MPLSKAVKDLVGGELEEKKDVGYGGVTNERSSLILSFLFFFFLYNDRQINSPK